MTSFGKWTPAVMIAPKNHIVSSDFTKFEPFFPSYFKEPPDMQLVMSNSYAKKWFEEKMVFKKKLLEYKFENEVFLMRRYVIRGLGKKMKDLELKRREPSRIKIGKKVPFAVRLLPPDENASPTKVSKSREKTPKSKPATPMKLAASSSHQDKKVEIDTSGVEKAISDFEELNRKLDEYAHTDTHLHAEQVGRKFKLYRVMCSRNHHHGCDCEVLKSDKCEV